MCVYACSYEEVMNPLGFVMNSIQDNEVAVQSRKVLRTTLYCNSIGQPEPSITKKCSNNLYWTCLFLLYVLLGNGKNGKVEEDGKPNQPEFCRRDADRLGHNIKQFLWIRRFWNKNLCFYIYMEDSRSALCAI